MVSKSKRRREAKARAQAQAKPVAAPAKKSKKSRANRKRAGPSNQTMVADFVSCVLNPFGSVGMASGVPDRFDGQSMVIENVTTFNAKPYINSGSMNMLVAPFFGCNAFMFKLDTGGTFSNVNMKTEQATVNVSEAAKFSQFRTVSLAIKVTYIGKPLDAAGVICATQVPIKLRSVQNILIPKTSVRVGTPTSGSVGTECEGFCRVDSDVADGETPDVKYKNSYARTIENFIFSQSAILAEPDSVMVPARNGGIFVAKHRTGDSWDFSDVDDESWYLTIYNTGTGEDGSAQKFDPMNLSADTFLGYDHSSYAVGLKFDGLVGDDFFIEIRHCIEAVPNTSAGIYRTLSRPSPLMDRAAIDKVVIAQRKLPTGAQGSDWFDYVKKAVSGVDVGALVKRIGHLAIGPAAGVLDLLF